LIPITVFKKTAISSRVCNSVSLLCQFWVAIKINIPGTVSVSDDEEQNTRTSAARRASGLSINRSHLPLISLVIG